MDTKVTSTEDSPELLQWKARALEAEQEINAMQALVDAATEGPWAYEQDEYDGCMLFVDEFGDGERPNPCLVIAENIRQGHDNGVNDAEFICNAREFVPKAIDTIRTLLAQLGNYESSLQTNQVLVQRLSKVVDVLPDLIQELSKAEAEADKAGENDGCETLYNATEKVGMGLRRLLLEINPSQESEVQGE